MNITVLAAGAWGTAFSVLLSDNGHNVKLWCHDPKTANEIRETQFNSKYLPGIKLNKNIVPITDFQTAFENTDLICQAIPVQFLRSILTECKNNVNPKTPWLILSKGIENNTLYFSSNIVDDVLKNVQQVVLSGPSFAQDLANKQLTAVTLASKNLELAKKVKNTLDNSYFKTKISDDIIGTQIAGALKNIVALALGILDGSQYSDNSKAIIFTQGLKEISQITKKLGGKIETIYDLPGIGDLFLTASSNKSKNFRLGQEIAKEKSLSKALQKFKSFPESPNTLKSVNQLTQKYQIKSPLFSNLFKILFENNDIETIFNQIF